MQIPPRRAGLQALILAVVLAVSFVLVPARGDGVSPFGSPPAPDPELRAAKQTMYFTDIGTNQVYVTQAKFRAKVKAFKLKTRIKGFKKPWDLALDPVAQAFLLVTNNARKTVSYVDTKTNKITAAVKVGKQPRGVAISPDGKYAVVANFKANSVSVIDIDALAAGQARSRPAVVGEVKVKKRPSGVAVNTRPQPAGEDRPAEFYVTNTASDVVTVIELENLIDAIENGGNVNNALEHVDVGGICDVNGDIDSTPFSSAFSFLVYSCERSGVASLPMAAGLPGNDAVEDSEDEIEDEEEEIEDEEEEGDVPAASPLDRVSRTVPFGFGVFGLPAGTVVSAITQTTPYSDPTFGCRRAAFLLGLAAPGAGPANGATYGYDFTGPPTEMLDGFPFGPNIGGGGDSVYAHSGCGQGCVFSTVAKQAAELTIPGAKDINSGAMPQVAPPGGGC